MKPTTRHQLLTSSGIAAASILLPGATQAEAFIHHDSSAPRGLPT